MVAFGQSGFNREIRYIRVKWFYSGKSGCGWVNVVFGKIGGIRAKVVVFGQSGCFIRVKW